MTRLRLFALRFLLLGVVLITILAAACAAPGPSSSAVKGTSIDAIRARGVLRAGLRQDLPRFAYLEPRTNRWDGFEVALARELAAALLGDPHKLELVRVTDTQRVPFLRDGSVDVVVAQLKRDTSSEIEVSDPYFVSGIGFLAARARSDTSVSELMAGPLCVAKRSWPLETLRIAAPSAGTLLVDASTECLPALAAGHASAMVADLPTLVRLALEDLRFGIHPALLREEPLVVGMPKDQPDLRRAVDTTLRVLQDSGRWTMLHRQYFDRLLPPTPPPR